MRGRKPWGAAALALILCAGWTEGEPRVRWLADNAVAVRSIEPGDEDVSDLMPLVPILGKVRAVQIGEASHGDGATFLAKARLIRFLHQKAPRGDHRHAPRRAPGPLAAAADRLHPPDPAELDPDPGANRRAPPGCR